MKKAPELASGRKTLKVLLVLAGQEFNGLAPGEIAKSAGIEPSAVTRYMAMLSEEGFAEQIQATGRWRLAPKIVQIAVAFGTSLTRAQKNLEEVTQRYTREI